MGVNHNKTQLGVRGGGVCRAAGTSKQINKEHGTKENTLLKEILKNMHYTLSAVRM
jgi:hypothetical protein